MSTSGLSKARLARMHNMMAGHVERSDVPGLVTLISRRGEVHVDAIGMKAVGGSDPMRRDTIFRAEQLMKIHLVDGTYELFRSFYGAPPKKASDGREVGATLGLLNSLLSLITKSGVTHIACAFDHVITSFRNDLFPGYKTGEGVEPALLAQFPLAEEVVAALGVVVWPMVEFEADDAIASAAARFCNEPGVEQIVICSPDKDLAQLVSGAQVVCWDRRRDIVYDEAAVVEKFGVRPVSIPDWLALVGDSADGYPGIPGWGAKSASAVLARYEHIESIPEDPRQWGLGAARALRLAESLKAHPEEVLLYRRLATLRRDVPLRESIHDLKWRGARERLRDLCRELGDKALPERASRWLSNSTARWTASSNHPTSGNSIIPTFDVFVERRNTVAPNSSNRRLNDESHGFCEGQQGQRGGRDARHRNLDRDGQVQ
jgi:5'-3' exonuclease